MLLATIIFGASATLFLLTYVLIGLEMKRGERLLLNGLRRLLDRLFEVVSQKVDSNWQHFVKYIVQLHWYYSIHSVLKAILRVIVAFYSYFESLFENNRQRAKKLRAEKKQISSNTHLRQVADHKEETALTPKQKQNLRKKRLEG